MREGCVILNGTEKVSRAIPHCVFAVYERNAQGNLKVTGLKQINELFLCSTKPNL